MLFTHRVPSKNKASEFVTRVIDVVLLFIVLYSVGAVFVDIFYSNWRYPYQTVDSIIEISHQNSRVIATVAQKSISNTTYCENWVYPSLAKRVYYLCWYLIDGLICYIKTTLYLVIMLICETFNMKRDNILTLAILEVLKFMIRTAHIVLIFQ